MTVGVRDNVLPDLTYADMSVPPVSIDEVSVNEGGTATYTVVPDSEPSSDLTVNLASIALGSFSTPAEGVTVSPDSLIFTVGANGNWETPQTVTVTVTVTGIADDDEFDDQAEIEHTTVLDEIIYRWPSVLVTVTDGNRAPYFEEGTDTTRAR